MNAGQAPDAGESGRTRGPSNMRAVLTSGDLAGVNLLAGLVLIRRRKVFHRMEREFRLEVICTGGKRQGYSVAVMTQVGEFPGAQVGLPSARVSMAGLFPPDLHPLLNFYCLAGTGGIGKNEINGLSPSPTPTDTHQHLKEASKGSRRATGLSRFQGQRRGTWQAQGQQSPHGLKAP